MTQWWNKNAENKINDFKEWVGDFNQITKSFCRKYVQEKKYKSILDCGCGVATEYDGYKFDNYEINYTGLDSCNFFVETNRKRGINVVLADLEQPLPFKNDLYECVYVVQRK